MRVDVVMPQLGESVVEGTVVKWLVEAGDTVAKDQPLLEISTDKVDAEIPSPEAGTVAEIVAKEGDTVPVEEVLCRIETEKAKPAAKKEEKAPVRTEEKKAEAEERAETAPPSAPEKTEQWDEEHEGFPGAMARKTGPPIPAAPREQPPKEPRRPAPPEGEEQKPKVRISPVVAKMAAEHGLDISRIRGTGIDGRVTKKDVEQFLARGGEEAAPAPAPEEKRAPERGEKPEKARAGAPAPPREGKAPAEEEEVVPFTPIRKKIAEHMAMSKRTSAHVHTFAEVDMHRIEALRAKRKAEGVSLTYLPFVIQAATRAIAEFPILNAQVRGESTVFKRRVHVGVAVDTEKGLIVPVIRDADKKSLAELSGAVDDFVKRAAAKRIMPDELAGGTFSVTNPGKRGNLFGTPVINQPQVGILRMGQVVKRPVVIEAEEGDAIVIRPMMYLCLAYDHRIVDGVAGNGFLYRVREILEAAEF